MTEPVVIQSLVEPATWLKILIAGLGTAGLYVLLASGLSLIFGLMGVLNFAHGALTTVGAYLGGLLLVAFVATESTGLAGTLLPLLAIFLVVAVLVGLLGSIVEIGLIRQLYDRPPIDQILLTFGIALVIEELLFIIVPVATGVDPTHDWATPAGRGPEFLQLGNQVSIFGAQVPGIRLFEIAIGAIVVVAVWAFLTRTRYGLYIRAGSEDSEMAQALGINVERVFTVVFGIGIALAGIAGTFLLFEVQYSTTIGLGAEVLLPAFIVVVVGGLGSFKGTVVASIVGGLFYELGVHLNTFYIQNPSTLPSMLIFLLLVVVLIVRPQGFFGQAEVGGH